jgi:hypothetical protein
MPAAIPTEPPAPKRRGFDLSWLLVLVGIAMTFLAFLAAAFWRAGYAIYLLAGGILVLVAGFAIGSRST